MKTYVTESVKNFSRFVAAMLLQLASVETMGSSDRRYVCQTDSPCRTSSPMGTGTSGLLADFVALVLSADRGAAVLPQ